MPIKHRVQAFAPSPGYGGGGGEPFHKGQKARVPDIGKLKGDTVTVDSELQPPDRQNPDGWYWVKFKKGGRVKMKAGDLRPI
jgi:hypothetical protein